MLSKDMKMMPWPGTTRPSRGTSPFRKVRMPSLRKICKLQSITPLYLFPSTPATKHQDKRGSTRRTMLSAGRTLQSGLDHVQGVV
jgi:hypothetical protein